MSPAIDIYPNICVINNAASNEISESAYIKYTTQKSVHGDPFTDTS